MFKLIIVDDEEETREGLIETIEWKKLQIEVVGQAEDGIEGCQVAAKVRPDIALMDVRMPRMNGIECAQTIRKELPECKIIFMSGYTDKEYLKSAIQLQAIDYIEKPIDTNEIYCVIKKTVLMCMDEKAKSLKADEIMKKAEYNHHMMEQSLVFELAHRNIDIGSLKKRFKDVTLPANENYLCVLQDFNLHKVVGGENSLTLRKNEIHSIITDNCEKIKGNYLCGIEDSGLAVLYIYGKIAEQELLIKSILENIQKGIGELYNSDYAVTIGVGKLVRGAENICKSYQVARKMIYKRFIWGYNSIFFYTDDIQHKDDADEALYSKLQSYINDVNIENAVTLAEKMVRDVMELRNVDVNRIKGIFLSFLMKISSIIKEQGVLFDEDGKDQTLTWAAILNFYTLDEIKMYIAEKLQYFVCEIEAQRGKSKKIRTVMDYIVKNYSEALSIASIADNVGLTPNYLCLLFKKETGQTLNEYIALVRIERSKKYLENENMKLTEVAKKVGYNNPNYFTTVFRKMTGMYPSEYRRKG